MISPSHHLRPLSSNRKRKTQTRETPHRSQVRTYWHFCIPRRGFRIHIHQRVSGSLHYRASERLISSGLFLLHDTPISNSTNRQLGQGALSDGIPKMQHRTDGCVLVFSLRSSPKISSSLIQAGSGSGGYLYCIIRQGRDCRNKGGYWLLFCFISLCVITIRGTRSNASWPGKKFRAKRCHYFLDSLFPDRQVFLSQRHKEAF